MNILRFTIYGDRNNWKTYSIPYGVGGRFSVFTEVGFVTAALVGFDIEGFLAGADIYGCKHVKKKTFLKIQAF